MVYWRYEDNEDRVRRNVSLREKRGGAHIATKCWWWWYSAWAMELYSGVPVRGLWAHDNK